MIFRGRPELADRREPRCQTAEWQMGCHLLYDILGYYMFIFVDALDEFPRKHEIHTATTCNLDMSSSLPQCNLPFYASFTSLNDVHSLGIQDTKPRCK
jgi:hypothetical protein